MTDVSTRHFYQFLAQFNKGGETWVDVADSYGKEDGVVLKCEFQEFMKAKWNGEESLSNDLINKFWKEIDTKTSGKFKSGTTEFYNLNALDSNEIGTVTQQLEVYIEFENFIKNNVTVPSVLVTTGAQWLSDVRDELGKYLEKYISSGSKGSLEEYLSIPLPAIKNEYTAIYCAVEYQETLRLTILKDYPDYKVAEDSTLKGLLNKYISTIDANTDPAEIKTEIRMILDSYFAHAGLGDAANKNYIVDKYGYDENQLSPIQIEVIKQTIKDELNGELENYKGYEAEFKEALDKFIDAKIKVGGTFEELKGSAQEFLTSEYKTQLDNVILIDKTYKDIVESNDPDSFYQKIVKKFGETLAKKIAVNDRYIQAYKDIISDVKSKVINGELAMDEVENYILDQISKNLDKFFSNGFGDMSIEELNDLYKNLVAAAAQEPDDEKSAQLIKDAALKYCNAITAKNNSKLTAVINDVFKTYGYSNYTTAITSMLPGDILEAMETITTKISEIGDISKFTVSGWNDLPATVAIAFGGSKNYKLNATVLDEAGQQIKSTERNITYDAIVINGKGNAKVVNDTLFLTGASASDLTEVEVSVLVDGVVVGTKTIKVQSVDANLDWASMTTKYNGYISTGGSDTPNGVQSISDLYNNNGVINLLPNVSMTPKGTDWKGAVATAKNSLNAFVDGTLVNAIKATGKYDQTALTYAATCVKGLYEAAFNQAVDGNHWANKKSAKENIVAYDGENYSYRVSKFYYESTAKNTDYSRSSSASNNQLGLSINESYNEYSSFQITVNVKCIMDLFSKFYEKALTK